MSLRRSLYQAMGQVDFNTFQARTQTLPAWGVQVHPVQKVPPRPVQQGRAPIKNRVAKSDWHDCYEQGARNCGSIYDPYNDRQNYLNCIHGYFNLCTEQFGF